MAKAAKQSHVVSILIKVLNCNTDSKLHVCSKSCCKWYNVVEHSPVYIYIWTLLWIFLLQGDYRQLVHELDQYQYSELRLVVLDICNTYVRHPHTAAYSWVRF